MLRANLAGESGKCGWTESLYGIVAAVALAMGGAADAATLNVPGDHPTIQAAVNAATDGDEVIVANGVYLGLGNRDIDLLGKSIAVRSASGAASCTIDCQQSGRAFYIHTGEGPQTVIEGFTIINGRASAAAPGGPFGGAIHITGASPTILNCIFDGNAVITDSQKAGGALYAADSSVHIEGCLFHHNSVATDGTLEDAGGGDLGGPPEDQAGFPVQGGGAVMLFNYKIEAMPVVQNCEFIENSTSAVGGAMGVQAEAFIIDCEFAQNHAHHGGAMYLTFSEPSIQGCVFTGNFSTIWGGAIYSDHADPSIRGCRFTQNSAVAGGAIESFASELKLRHSTFLGNQGDSGGALRTYKGSSQVFNCVFFGNNSSGNGGAMRVFQATSTVVNCSAAHNTAIAGGGISAGEYGQPVMTNCIFWDNTAPTGPEAAIDVNNSRGAVLSFNHCNVKGGQKLIELGFEGTLVWGEANIDLDPMFIMPDGFDGDPTTLNDNNYRLHGGSPCIDAGDNAALPEDLLLDMDGNPRFLDDPSTPDSGIGSGGSGVVDLGAFEFQGVTGDVNGDGAVDIDDLMLVIASWGQCTGLVCPSDLTGDGLVGCDDLLMVINNWS